jgi:hypothetical protein
MGEITDYVRLYIEDSDVLEEKTKEVSRSLKTNIQNVIAPGKVGYDTGHLHDTIQSNHAIAGKVGVVVGWYLPDYGKYWYRWKGGKDFLKVGLEETMKLYG